MNERQREAAIEADAHWLTKPMECESCGRDWVAVWPSLASKVPSDGLECPTCGAMNLAEKA